MFLFHFNFLSLLKLLDFLVSILTFFFSFSSLFLFFFRFTNVFPLISQLLKCLALEVQKFSKQNFSLAKSLTSQVGLFVRGLLDIMDRGLVRLNLFLNYLYLYFFYFMKKIHLFLIFIIFIIINFFGLK